jgi:hypothetical protein
VSEKEWLLIEELPKRDPRRREALVKLGAECRNTMTGSAQGAWRKVEKGWRIAVCSWADLGPGWTGSYSFRIPAPPPTSVKGGKGRAAAKAPLAPLPPSRRKVEGRK